MVSIKLVRYASPSTGADGKLSLASVEGGPERLGKAFLILHCIVLTQRRLHRPDCCNTFKLWIERSYIGESLSIHLGNSYLTKNAYL